MRQNLQHLASSAILSVALALPSLAAHAAGNDKIQVVVTRTIMGMGRVQVSGTGSFEVEPPKQGSMQVVNWNLTLTHFAPVPVCTITSNPDVMPMISSVAGVGSDRIRVELVQPPHTWNMVMRCGKVQPPTQPVRNIGGTSTLDLRFIEGQTLTNRFWKGGPGNYGEDTYTVQPLCPPVAGASETLEVAMPSTASPTPSFDRSVSAAALGKIAPGQVGTTGFFGNNQNDVLGRASGPVSLRITFGPDGQAKGKGCFYVRSVEATYLPMKMWLATELSLPVFDCANRVAAKHEWAHATKFRELTARHRARFQSMLKNIVADLPTAAHPRYSTNIESDRDTVVKRINKAYMDALGFPADEAVKERLDRFDRGEEMPGVTRKSLNAFPPGSFYSDQWIEDQAESDSLANYKKISEPCPAWP